MNLYPKPNCGGNHSTGKTLIEIFAVRDQYGVYASGEEQSVKWCQECGAVVVDKEIDGRFAGAVVTMKFPKVLLQGIPIPPQEFKVEQLMGPTVSKGGVNTECTVQRPPPPQAQGESITREIHLHFAH